MATKHLVATSLSEATRAGKRLHELVLRQSADLKCMNLMCEKVGEACICRLARVLSLTPEVERLDLGKNDLTALPEEVFKLSKLRSLDLSHNRLSALPPSILKLSQLEVLVLEGNPIATLETNTGGSTSGILPPEDVETAELVQRFVRERIKGKNNN